MAGRIGRIGRSYRFKIYQKANIRYVLSYCSLLLLFMASCFTFYTYFSFSSDISEGGIQFYLENIGANIQNTDTFFSWEILLLNVTDWVESHHPRLDFGLVCRLFAVFTRLVGGLWQVHVLQTSGLVPLSADWQGRLDDLITKTNYNRKIGLFFSPKVESPLTIGFFKPIILLPFGFINQLSTEQVEAALAHELAHIIRHDFGLNLFQSILEVVYYYHPAVWFLGKIIREEREHCCDDFAMNLIQNPIMYAKTLVEIETIQHTFRNRSKLALALAGPSNKSKKPILLTRIQRILNQSQQKNTQIMEKFAATVLLLFCLTAWSFQGDTAIYEAENVAEDISNESEFENDFLMSSDTIKPKVDKRSIEKFKKIEDDKEVEVTMENGDITELVVDGKTIPASEYDAYESTIDEMTEIKEETDAKRMEKRIVIFNDSDEEITWNEQGEGEEHRVRVTKKGGDGASRMTTTTDGEGNTTIIINNGGEDSEIKVVDGKVYMNGEEVEDGDTRVIVGDGESSIFIEEDGDYEMLTGDDVEIIRIEREAELHDRLQEVEGLLEERREEIEVRVRHAMEKAEQEIQRIEIEIEEIADEIEMDLDSDGDRNREYTRSGSWSENGVTGAEMSMEIRRYLVSEGVLDEDQNLNMTLTAKKAVVNGKKQSDKIHNGLKRLYETVDGNPINKRDKVKIKERHF